jgi:hypothetical protein
MLSNAIKVALVVLLTLSSSAAVRADPARVAATINVGFNQSADLALEIAAHRLIESGQRIRLEYGAATPAELLRLKTIDAPNGIGVTLKAWSFGLRHEEQVIGIQVRITNTEHDSGNHPVRLVLENTETQATTTLELIVQAP